MVTDKALKRELMASAFKSNIGITISDEIDYLDVHFEDKRFDFIEHFENQYHAYLNDYYTNDAFYELQQKYVNYCKQIFDKLGYTSPDGVDITIGNKTKNYKLAYAEDNFLELHNFSVTLTVCPDSEVNLSGILLDFIDLNEIQRLYLQHTDSLLDGITEFMHHIIDSHQEDVYYKYDHDAQANLEETQVTLIKMYNNAINDLNKLKNRLDLPIEKFKRPVFDPYW